MKIAIVVGGSSRVWSDLRAAEIFCEENGLSPEYFAVNDAIQYLYEPIIAVSLHPDKLPIWLTQRLHSGFVAPLAVYTHDGGGATTQSNIPSYIKRLKDWGGSSGMFGYVVARARGYDRVILCGVPMTKDPHFVRKTSWRAASVFTKAWEVRKAEMMPYCRSMSGGLTEEIFGWPTEEWVKPKERE